MPFFFIPLIVLGLIILFAAFFTVKQQTAAIIERFGKFQSIRQSGLHLKIPIIDRIAGRLSLKIQQLDVLIETKTLAPNTRVPNAKRSGQSKRRNWILHAIGLFERWNNSLNLRVKT